MKIKMKFMAIVVFIVIFGGIAATVAADWWTSTNDKKPAKYETGEAAGSSNPADIRGSYTFKDVADSFDIDQKILFRAFGIPEDTDGAAMQTKDLETIFAGQEFEIGNESVQVFVALYKNLPITLEDTYLPKQAVGIIIEANSKLTAEQKSYLHEHQVDVGAVTLPESPVVIEEEPDEELVNGGTTFQQLLDAGITKEQIEEIIGTEMPAGNLTVKDFCTQAGLKFSTVKGQLSNLVK